MRISDWSSDVCSSDLLSITSLCRPPCSPSMAPQMLTWLSRGSPFFASACQGPKRSRIWIVIHLSSIRRQQFSARLFQSLLLPFASILGHAYRPLGRSEAHTYELQSLMRISYAVF